MSHALTVRAGDRHHSPSAARVLPLVMSLALGHTALAEERPVLPESAAEREDVDRDSAASSSGFSSAGSDDARALPFPSLTVGAQVARLPSPAGGVANTWSVGLTLAWPLSRTVTGAWRRGRARSASVMAEVRTVERTASLLHRRAELQLVSDGERDPLPRALTRLRLAEVDAELAALGVTNAPRATDAEGGR